jgi:hypothetical protein
MHQIVVNYTRNSRQFFQGVLQVSDITSGELDLLRSDLSRMTSYARSYDGGISRHLTLELREVQPPEPVAELPQAPVVESQEKTTTTTKKAAKKAAAKAPAVKAAAKKVSKKSSKKHDKDQQNLSM